MLKSLIFFWKIFLLLKNFSTFFMSAQNVTIAFYLWGVELRHYTSYLIQITSFIFFKSVAGPRLLNFSLISLYLWLFNTLQKATSIYAWFMWRISALAYTWQTEYLIFKLFKLLWHFYNNRSFELFLAFPFPFFLGFFYFCWLCLIIDEWKTFTSHLIAGILWWLHKNFLEIVIDFRLLILSL